MGETSYFSLLQVLKLWRCEYACKSVKDASIDEVY
jgi:hypothetical protein